MAIDKLTTRGSERSPDSTGHGAIVLGRHGEPALSRRVRLTSDGYRRWWGTYEEVGLLEGQVAPEGLKAFARGAYAIFCSTRPRSIETARALAGDKPFVEDPLFVEAPLPPPHFSPFWKFSPRTWGVIARLWWWLFDHHEGQETLAEAKVRAKAAAKSLDEMAQGGRDILVTAHGFFNGMIGWELKRLGWKLVKDGGFKYWAARRFEKR
ncbi:MAG: histidine phosphatase family protein [Proteobacteria bacterium]|nr:histidine phosphatase family protein [Pseudomonadota bacterium]